MRELFLRVEGLPRVELQLKPTAIRALPTRIDALVLRIVLPMVLAIGHLVSTRLQLLPDVAVASHVLGIAETEGVPNSIVNHGGRLGGTRVYANGHPVHNLFLEAVSAFQTVLQAD